MLHQLLFLVFYLGLLPVVLVSPFAGVLIYNWLDWLPPDQVYTARLLSDYLSFAVGALTFFVWIVREQKILPRPLPAILLMAALLIWMNITWQFALAPEAGAPLWNRTVKVIGFAILTAQMLSSRSRLEGIIWTLVLAVTYFATPSALKVLVSGGAGGIGSGDVVEGAAGSFFGDRVFLSVVMAMALPFALYLGRHATLLPVWWRRWVKPAMFAVAAACLIASIGTFARTAVFASGAALLMLAIRSKRKARTLLAVAFTVLALTALAPANWFSRMDTIVQYEQDSSATSRLAVWQWAWHFTLQHPILGGGFGVFHLDAGSIPGRPGWLEAHNILFEIMAEQGFIGLALFCGLIFATYYNCAAVQRRVRARDDLGWAADLAGATQVALAAYVAGGMFVSIATSPFLYMLAAVTVGTRSLVEREMRTGAKRTTRPSLVRPDARSTIVYAVPLRTSSRD